jgi:nucleoside-diphosphate-sugar epimerase
MKILVCGDRNWNNAEAMARELMYLSTRGDITIIHGDCRGADKMAREVAAIMGFTVIAVPAEWEKYGRRAGHVRNKKMFDENRPDLVLAFHEHINESKGTKHMIEYAKKKGCPTRLVAE